MNKKYIIIGICTIIALYALLSVVSPLLANVVLTLIILLGIVLSAGYLLFKNKIALLFINFVPLEFRHGTNGLMNKSITINYTPGKRIIVVDNFCETSSGKRTFTISAPAADVDKIWCIICLWFNKSTTLGALASHLRKYTPVEITNIDREVNKPKKKVIDRSYYQKSPESFIPKQTVPEIVDFNNLTPQAPSVKKEDEAGYSSDENVNLEEFFSMGDIKQKSLSKVNINTATASEIAVLHGINIAVAKKAVEYRDLNGGFKSVEEFIEVAEVKEHFVQKIKDLVVLEENAPAPSSIEHPNDGRLLDW